MNFEDAIRLLPRGKSILFTGSGFSFGAKNARIDENGNHCEVRGATQITYDMAKMANILDEKNLNLGDVAEYCVEHLPIGQFIKFLKDEFTIVDISDEHLTVGSIKWRRCYTTNYDEIVEIAHKRNGKSINSVTISEPEKKGNSYIGACVHLNGIVSQLSEDTLNNEFKLTHRSYLVDEFTSSDWYGQFKEDLLNADAVFFIGFSGDYDLDIKRVFESTKELREKSFFIVSPDSGKLSVSKLEKFGSVLPIGLSGFVKKYEEISSEQDYPIESIQISIPLKCFRKINSDDIGEKKEIESKYVVSLLNTGEINPILLNRSVREPNDFKYYIYRSKIDHVIRKIQDGHKHFLVTSSLGNGKTLFLEGLAIKLSRKGYQVFVFDKERDFVVDEVERICTDNQSPVIIVDNYVQYTQVIKRIYRKFTNNTILILSERTSRYEMSLDIPEFIEETLYGVSIDKLNKDEMKSIVTLFNRYGLWGDKAAYSDTDKVGFIRNNCKGSFCNLLLNRLDAQQLKESYSGIIQAIKDRKEYYQAILLILFSNFFGFRLEYGSLIESMTGNVLNNPSFKKNHNIKELIDFEKEKITFRSSILAMHILTKHIAKDDFKEFYISLFVDLDKKSKGNKVVRSALKEMMKHSNLYKFFGNNNPIYSIYDNISGCQFTSHHPLFWLQYAIAKTSDNQYDDAQRYFDTSYALAKAKDNFDTFQIDNHYARFLLSNALHGHDLSRDEAFKVFQDAHKKLMTKRKGDEYRHYIYSVAEDYEPYWKKYSKYFSQGEMDEFHDCCNDIIVKAEAYLGRPNISKKEIVERTLKSLQTIVKK